MDKVDVAIQRSRDRVRQRADGGVAACFMSEGGEVGIEELVGMLHSCREAEPIAGG